MTERGETISMTQTEAARQLRISDRTLRTWDKNGIIRGRRVANGKRLYLAEDVKALVKAGTQQ